MEIIGLGSDIEECKRFKNKDAKFYSRIFTENEIKYCQSNKNSSEHFAARFCAKEACIKALNDKTIPLKEIEIIKTETGSPVLSIKDKRYKTLKFYTSISHTKEYAQATVIVTI